MSFLPRLCTGTEVKDGHLWWGSASEDSPFRKKMTLPISFSTILGLWQDQGKITVCSFSSRVPVLHPTTAKRSCAKPLPRPTDSPRDSWCYQTVTGIAGDQVKSSVLEARTQTQNNHLLPECLQDWPRAGQTFNLGLFIRMQSLAYLIFCHSYLYKPTYTIF